jgi:hypothetical protein
MPAGTTRRLARAPVGGHREDVVTTEGEELLLGRPREDQRPVEAHRLHARDAERPGAVRHVEGQEEPLGGGPPAFLVGLAELQEVQNRVEVFLRHRKLRVYFA